MKLEERWQQLPEWGKSSNNTFSHSSALSFPYNAQGIDQCLLAFCLLLNKPKNIPSG